MFSSRPDLFEIGGFFLTIHNHLWHANEKRVPHPLTIQR